MRSKLAVFFIVLSILVAELTPRAQAVVGGIVSLFGGGAGIPVMIVGGAAIAAGGATFTLALNDEYDTAVLAWGAIVGAAGIVILNQDGKAIPQFIALDEVAGNQIGLSSDELTSYNTELEEINAMAQSIGMQLAKSRGPSVEQSQAMWNLYKDMLSDHAFSALGKISSNALTHSKQKE